MYKKPRKLFWKNKNIFELNKLGNIVQDCWLKIPQIYNDIFLDEFVIMSNHIHGIIVITEKERYSINHIIRQFKSAVTKEIRNIVLDKKLEIWQRNYYEHIIREKEIDKIRWYISNNPHNVYKDRYD